MNIETRKLGELIYAEYNPRKSLTAADEEYRKITRSIEEFGYIDPIIINSDNTIIGGHQRATVLKDMGYAEVQVVVVDLPKDKEKTLNIALNKISGEWDIEKLQSLLLELENLNYDISITGFDEAEIEELLGQLRSGHEVMDDDFDAESAYEEIEEPVSRPGDIWQLGEHRLLCGDATIEADVLRLMAGETAQLIVTDPPYNVDYEGAAGKIANDSMSSDAFYNFLLAAFKNLYSVAEPGAAIYVFHADLEGNNFRRALADSGFTLKQCLVWVKNQLVLGRQDYQWRHEPILYGWKGGAAHFFINDRKQTTVFDFGERPNFKAMKKEELLKKVIELYEQLESAPQTVIYCDKPSKSAEHPTMKPLELVGRLIANSSKKDWIVADLFGGSGSTLIACEQLGRRSRIIEYDPKYADVIVKRYSRFIKKSGQEPIVTLTRDGQSVDIDLSIFN